MTKSLNDKRRELIQTPLIVGGIIGALSQFATAMVLEDLVIFIFLAILLYTELMRDNEKLTPAYPVLAIFASFFFAAMLYLVILGAVKDSNLALLELFGMTVVISISLTYNRDKKPTPQRGVSQGGRE